MKNRAIRLVSILGMGLSSLSMNATMAQESSAQNSETQQGQAVVIKPRITLTETWSDNVEIGGGQSNKESGLITQLAPGVRIDAKTARLKAYFDYAAIGQFYSTSSANSRTQNALNTFGTLEAISNWMFLDFSGLIAQQSISAFGAQSPSNANINANSAETATYRLSPYIRGQLAGIVDYSLRYTWSTTQSNVSAASDIELSDWAGQLRGSTPFQNLKWSVDTSVQNAAYSPGRATEAQRAYGMATYTVIPQFRVSLSGGQESNNYASQTMESHPTHGYGFDWSPTERTNISAFKERRFFGDGHKYSFSHRFPLSNIRYSDTKDVSVLPNQFMKVGFGTVYDLYYPIAYQQCAQDTSLSSTDLNTCALNLLSKLPALPNTLVTSDFLRTQATLQRNQQLAIGVQGTRNTLTVMFNRNQSQNMLAVNGVNNAFSQNNFTDISQRGISINLAHTLSSLTNVILMTSRQKSTGRGANTLEATTSMYQANINSKFGAKTIGGITIRRTEFDSSTNPFTENAIIGTVSVIF